MNSNNLKNRPPYPFETIAVAVAFSPRLNPILTEGIRIQKCTGARLILIHVGKKTNDKVQKLNEIIKNAEAENLVSEIIWKPGKCVDVILSECKSNSVDLLILGALHKENIFKYYVGSVARDISRKAKCSVLLFTDPVNGGHKLGRIVVNGTDQPKTMQTIATSIYFAKQEGAKELTIVRELHNPALAMSMADSSTAPEATRIKKELKEVESSELHNLIASIDTDEVAVVEKTVSGKPGFAISKYAKSRKADLLVINSPDSKLNIIDRIFTHDIEYILEDLPCNLMIVHSRGYNG